jgi:hypothetical protein
MRYVYSVVRYVPNPASGEFVNIGVIAGSDETGDWSLRQAGNPRRARLFGPLESLNAVDAFMNDLGSKLDKFDLMQNDEVSEAWLGDLCRRYRNIVQLSTPAPVIANSAEEAVDFVFSQVIIDDPGAGSPTRDNVTRLRLFSELKNGFRRSNIQGSLLREKAMILSAGFQTPMDFVVGDSAAVQLVHTWSFQIQSLSEVARDIKSWGFTLERLRERGGRVLGDRAADIRPDTPVEVVYAPPLTNAQRDVFEEAKRVFGDIGVAPVPRDAIARVVGEAREQLVRAGLTSGE